MGGDERLSGFGAGSAITTLALFALYERIAPMTNASGGLSRCTRIHDTRKLLGCGRFGDLELRAQVNELYENAWLPRRDLEPLDYAADIEAQLGSIFTIVERIEKERQQEMERAGVSRPAENLVKTTPKNPNQAPGVDWLAKAVPRSPCGSAGKFPSDEFKCRRRTPPRAGRGIGCAAGLAGTLPWRRAGWLFPGPRFGSGDSARVCLADAEPAVLPALQIDGISG